MSSESTQAHGLRDSKRLRWVYLALSLLSRARIGSRHRVFLLAVVIGVAGALSSYLFKELVHGINHLMTGTSSKGYVDAFQHLSLLQRILIPTIGSAIAGLLLMAGKRIDNRQATDYMEAVSLGNGDVPARPSILKSVAAACSIGSGVSIGREGPLVQLAAVGASILGRLLRTSCQTAASRGMRCSGRGGRSLQCSHRGRDLRRRNHHRIDRSRELGTAAGGQRRIDHHYPRHRSEPCLLLDPDSL